MTPPEIQQMLQAGIDAVKRGQKQRARELLLKVVEEDEHSEQAWLWLSAVMDTLQDQITALENVARINPNNQAAQRGLATLRSRLAVYAPISPVESVSAIDDPYQCIYCGATVARELKRCPECKRSLMVKTGQQYVSSTLRTAVFVLIVQIALAAVEAIAVAVFYYQGDSFLIKYVFETLGLDVIFGNYLVWPAGWTAVIVWIGFVWVAVLAAAMAGLFYRIGLAYYGAIGAMALNILWALFRWLNGFSGPVLGIADIVFSIAALSFIFAAERDFEVNDTRRVCAVDPRIKGAESLHKLGHEYKNRGQWALAVQYWRAAVGAMPTQASFYRDLAIGCAQIGYYERSLKALDEFARLAPDNADVAQMRELIQQKRAADPKPRG